MGFTDRWKSIAVIAIIIALIFFVLTITFGALWGQNRSTTFTVSEGSVEGITLGNGIPASENRSVAGFHGIEASGIFQVTVDLSGREGLLVNISDGNLLSYLQTVVENGILKIRLPGTVVWKNNNHYARVTVRALRIDYLDASGTSHITVQQKLNQTTGAVKLISSGSSHVTVSVNTTTLTAVLSGSGNIAVSGNVTAATVTASGVAQFNGRALDTTNCQVTVSGSAALEVTVRGHLSGSVSGVGLVRYAGNPSPAVNVATSGAGRVQPIS